MNTNFLDAIDQLFNNPAPTGVILSPAGDTLARKICPDLIVIHRPDTGGTVLVDRVEGVKEFPPMR